MTSLGVFKQKKRTRHCPKTRNPVTAQDVLENIKNKTNQTKKAKLKIPISISTIFYHPNHRVIALGVPFHICKIISSKLEQDNRVFEIIDRAHQTNAHPAHTKRLSKGKKYPKALLCCRFFSLKSLIWPKLPTVSSHDESATRKCTHYFSTRMCLFELTILHKA